MLAVVVVGLHTARDDITISLELCQSFSGQTG